MTCWTIAPEVAPAWVDDGEMVAGWLSYLHGSSIAMEAIAGYAIANLPYSDSDGWTIPSADATAPICTV